MDIATQITLSKFKPRFYQTDLYDALLNRGYKKLLCIWPRRCLSGESIILLSDGSPKKLKDIRKGDMILSWNGHAFEADIVKEKWSTGIKETVKVRASCFPEVVTSADHLFAYMNCGRDVVSWVKASEIGKFKQVLNYAGIGYGSVHSPDLAEFIGYLICDGYVCDYQQPKFTNTNLEILKRVAFLAEKLFSIEAIWRKKGNGYDLGLSNGTKGGGKTKNPIKELFRDEGQDVQKSQKRLLSFVWKLDEESLGRFFAAVISSDGSIYSHSKGFSVGTKEIAPSTEISISCGGSDALKDDYYWLLRKIGILPQNPYKERGRNWKIKISKNADVRFLLSAGQIYGKTEAQQSALTAISSFAKGKQKACKGCFRNRASSSSGTKEELYDIETEKNHNFIANGYLVHNSGKDIAAFNLMIRECLFGRVGVYYYVFPTYSQARKALWDSISNDGVSFLSYAPEALIARKNDQEMKILFKNGSLLQLCGSSDYDRLMGTNPCGVVFSEYALQDPRAYQYIKPILMANNGWAIFATTVRGKNHLWELYNIASTNKSWYCSKLSVEDTKHLNIQDIEDEIASGEISRDLALQEYYNDFSLGVEGAYYAKYIDKMRINNQIGPVNWEPSFKVSTAWDLGMRDSTAIIFFQVIGQTVKIIDVYQNTGQGLEHYSSVLSSKPYQYNLHLAPHDIAVRELGTGLSRLEKARQLGISFVTVPNLPIIDGIESVRSTLPKMWIDEGRCSKLITALENYRKEYDSKLKIYHDRPLHDHHSHFCDSVRYLCLGLPKTKDGMSAEDLQKLRYEALYGDSGPNSGPFGDNRRRY
jgi:phage terminase large subunit